MQLKACPILFILFLCVILCARGQELDDGCTADSPERLATLLASPAPCAEIRITASPRGVAWDANSVLPSEEWPAPWRYALNDA
jgi:hypothetical protein